MQAVALPSEYVLAGQAVQLGEALVFEKVPAGQRVQAWAEPGVWLVEPAGQANRKRP